VLSNVQEDQLTVLAAQGYNRVPVARTVLADTETPLSVYQKLARGPRSFLFESVQGGEKWGRYSIIGLPATQWLSVSGCEVTEYRGDDVLSVQEVSDPLAFVEQYQRLFHVAPQPNLPVFHGGLVGYFGYDAVRYVETRLGLSTREDPLGNPDILLMVAEEVVVFDNLAGTLTMVINVDPSDADSIGAAERRLEALESKLAQPVGEQEPVALGQIETAAVEARATYVTPKAEFEDWVTRIKEYILDGDVMQVVPSQRMVLDYQAQPLTLYRALRNLNPSPYLYFLDLGDFQIVGSSPEILVRAEAGQITVRPIAGTRKRGKNDAEDAALAADLLADAKEIAEHLMLIDLGRNDVGRIAQPGSVQVTENMVVERYSHVMHIVSNVTGTARSGLSAIDALRATLPAGTLSGAPKVRAMEIIDELEPVKRGVYGGAIGYLSWAGDMDTAIAIRTAVIKSGKLVVQAGAGIVADSVPQSEWEETVNKARAILRAVAMTEVGV
jgi:anthranilate synthase component 1